MTYYIEYASPMLAAQTMARMLSSEQHKYSPRPWNPFKPAETLWWVVPSTKWPAYQHGKYIFWKRDNKISCGFNIEKGLAQVVAAGYPKTERKGLIMKGDWLWHGFMRDLRSGEIGEAVKNAEKSIGSPLELHIGTGLASDPDDFDPHAPQSHFIKFHLINDHLSLLDDSESGLLEPLAAASSITELAEHYIKIDQNQLDWMWVDLIISADFPIATREDASGESQVLDCFLLHQKLLGHFETWLR